MFLLYPREINTSKFGQRSLFTVVCFMFSEKNYILARYHFLHSRDGAGFATMLVELNRTRGYSSEVDLFIAQVVLQ